MSSALFLLSTEADSGKSALALALFEAMARRVPRPAVFRPVTRDGGDDFLVDLLLSRLPEAARPDPEDCVGVTYDENHADAAATRATVVARFRALAARHDAVLVVGSDFTDVGAASELATNIDLAQDLAAPVVAVVSGRDRDGARSVADVRAATEHALDSLLARHTPVIGVVANRVEADTVEELTAVVREVVASRDLDVPTAVVPELPLLAAPTLRQISDAVGARLVSGSDDDLDRAAVDVMVAAMTLPHMLDRLVDQAVVIVPGDRSDVLVGTLAAAHADTFPTPAGLVLTGGFEPDPVIARLVAGFSPSPPVVVAPGSTFEVATVAAGLRGRMRSHSSRKIEAALQLAAEHVPAEAWLDRLALAPTDIVTPVMFTHDLYERARSDRRRIVLPEGTEPRVLRAAAAVQRRGVADLVLLGRPDEVLAAASVAGVDVSGAEVVDPATDPRRERYAEEYARLRAHRGVSLAMATDTVADVSYFGTLMVHLGEADGMVSGAVHTTAHTIRPAFEIIRTVPDVSVVSSVFFMLLPDKVLVYGDCAVVPSPDARQLADIAISAAGTAAAFGVEPRVAMLSYSTGSSGSGADVDRVREATELVRERRPDLLVEGPLQYDAAVDPAVAATKLPGSEVAGRATVLVFPDLNTGNNTYKAVQRSAGATAVGPVLQGLNKPVNDLSRGATVDDIATTVAVTAVQAQTMDRAREAAPQAEQVRPVSVLVINAGSSSLKYALVEPGGSGPATVLARGLLERVGTSDAVLTHVVGAGDKAWEHRADVEAGDHTEAMVAVAAAFGSHGPDVTDGLRAVGHRVVHGGQSFSGPVLVDDDVLGEIDRLSVLAPLHNPVNVAGLRAARERFADVPHVAVFDTAFHADLPAVARAYAVPRAWREEHGVRRYGFHGTSHAYVSRTAAAWLQAERGVEPSTSRVVVLHLGNGASACAVLGGRSVDTSMGLTPLAGLVMGTRSGDVDPALPGHLERVAGLDGAHVEEQLNRASGLKGLAGASDLRDVARAAEGGDEDAALALDLYAYRIRSYVGAYAVALGGLDALALTGGVGENDAAMRARIVDGLGLLGCALDEGRNGTVDRGLPVSDVSAGGSAAAVLVVPTDEEGEIARQAVALLDG